MFSFVYLSFLGGVETIRGASSNLGSGFFKKKPSIRATSVPQHWISEPQLLCARKPFIYVNIFKKSKPNSKKSVSLSFRGEGGGKSRVKLSV